MPLAQAIYLLKSKRKFPRRKKKQSVTVKHKLHAIALIELLFIQQKREKKETRPNFSSSNGLNSWAFSYYTIRKWKEQNVCARVVESLNLIQTHPHLCSKIFPKWINDKFTSIHSYVLLFTVLYTSWNHQMPECRIELYKRTSFFVRFHLNKIGLSKHHFISCTMNKRDSAHSNCLTSYKSTTQKKKNTNKKWQKYENFLRILSSSFSLKINNRRKQNAFDSCLVDISNE